MSNTFRELLRKIGSGVHTGENLTRTESAAATRMMLLGEATPAQIGAFMISHRIKRPTGEELAGMLDAYEELGPKLAYPNREKGFTVSSVAVFGVAYDGRSRTAPVSPLTALILATAGVPTLMHGGDIMPTKEGIPLIEIWCGLGVDWTKLAIEKVQQVFDNTGLGFVHIPTHFPQANSLVPYRREIGKRPPFATMELMWCPCDGDVNVISGYVHPPTEGMFIKTFELRGIKNYTTVKGLEGSCDLPRDRTAIIGIAKPDTEFERVLLAHGDYGFSNTNPDFESTSELLKQMQEVLQGKPSELMQSAIWNGGFYLWRCGICLDINSGFIKAEVLLSSGQVMQKLQEVSNAVDC
ncbi:anthranilate phosphoribosyltransferase family protein [Tychonema sp. BBK16]|uniref:anthranilate phosphoribosyltransferase family protein n=1 Tax=Tychonema sp. BBK16 TaxID=2699888 RepID=UPI001F1A7938|nr:anthranilate phosphoribosyltransferase family protein [Tychonema sp. BBK16]MCF6372678.1 anthranilate phosphoribosyltransferase family protein [Tychonema sp. BBK16]